MKLNRINFWMFVLAAELAVKFVYNDYELLLSTYVHVLWISIVAFQHKMLWSRMEESWLRKNH